MLSVEGANILSTLNPLLKWPSGVESRKIGLITAGKPDKLSPAYTITGLHKLTKLL